MAFKLNYMLRALSVPIKVAGYDNAVRRACYLIVVNLFVLLFCMHGHVYGAYIPPIGIPAPSFGIDETVESVYGSADYYTYYIDNTDSNATDTGNPNGSPTKPRLTIPSTLTAGDVVQIHGGPYTPSSGRFFFYGQGTQTQPIFITGANAASKPVFTKFVHFPDAQWVIFEGIKLQTTQYAVDIRPLNSGVIISHISIRNCEMAGSGGFKSAQSFGVGTDVTGTSINNVVLYNNISYDAGQWDSVAEDDTASFSIQHNVSYAWVLDNVAYRSGGDGVILAHAAGFSTHHIYIGRNTFYQHRENGIDLKQANDVVVSQNKIYNHRPTSTSAGECIVIHYEPQRIWLLFNEIYDCDYGIISTGSTDTYMIGNLIHNIHHTSAPWNPDSGYASGAAIHFRGASSGGVYNNTLYDYDIGIQLTQGGSYDVQNNIFAGRAEVTGQEIRVANTVIASNATFDYNLLYYGGGNSSLYWGAPPAVNLAMFKESYGKCLSCPVELDPQFLNAPFAFSLKDTSPAKDSGVSLPVYNDFFLLYNLNISTDITGSPRPYGVWDIGAFEEDPSEVPTVGILQPITVH